MKNLKLLHDEKLVDGSKLDYSENMKLSEGDAKGSRERNRLKNVMLLVLPSY